MNPLHIYTLTLRCRSLGIPGKPETFGRSGPPWTTTVDVLARDPDGACAPVVEDFRRLGTVARVLRLTRKKAPR